ncbi:hypothetical protein PK28_10865 [Hymenobacter sp. DG25B]|uniref:hypothetical protein n=1 Tax=Hymenobacter sp. DG25B TaxID=1385664 RepID=UPI0005412B0A|nr:hypothetical protein [Hymenobacter sp. DG25B]AIZ64074.1 hypothetical protein PK28_10865 [Hymenobacter sp. DG25B]
MPEKLQTLLFIAIGLFIFIVRMWRKAQETMRREAQERPLPKPVAPAQRPAQKPAVNFEELLQQMMEQNQPRKPQPEVTPAGRAIPQESARPARSLEVTDSTARSLEVPAMQRQARSQEVEAGPTRRAAVLPRAAVAHGQEDYWSRQSAAANRPHTAADVAAHLRNPTDVRTAFVLAEVLQRRF